MRLKIRRFLLANIMPMQFIKLLGWVFALVLFGANPSFAKTGDRLILQNLGACVVTGHEQQLLDFENESIPGREYKQRSAFVYKYVSDCLPKVGLSSVNLSPWQLDGLLSEALVRSIFAENDPGDLGQVAGTGVTFTNARPTNMSTDFAVRSKSFREYLSGLEQEFVIVSTECFVRTNSSGVRAFLLSEAESKDEAVKLASLNDTIAACMPTNSHFGLSLSEARNWMAMSYRKLASIKVKGN